jgi:hypothetical protein
MPFDPHERAHFLIDESRVAGISAEDARWLQSHTAECVACARHEETTARILRGLNDFSFETSRTDHRISWSVRRPKVALRWTLAAAAVLLLAAAPLYKAARDARRERADALFLEGVGTRVSRVVPAAMEPLMHPQAGEPQ